MGNINLYKSTTGKAPWSLVKENIASPVTITESTGGSLYYAVRDEGNGSNIKPSNYKVISKPVYVFKSTDKVNNIAFDDTTNMSALNLKVTSTCGDASNHKVQIEINVKNTGWKKFQQVAIGANVNAAYIAAPLDGVTEGDQIKFRAYIFNTSNSNYRTANSAEYVYTLEYINMVPTIDGSMPIDSRGYGNTSLSNIYSIFDSTGSISYGKGSDVRIPLTRDNIYAMFDSSSNINVPFGYKALKIGVLSELKTSSFTAINAFYKKGGITVVNIDGKASFPTSYAINGQEKTTTDKLPTDMINGIIKRTITIAGVNFNYYGFGFSNNGLFICRDERFTVTAIQRSSTIASAIVCYLDTVVAPSGVCSYCTSIDTSYGIGLYFKADNPFFNVVNNIPDNTKYAQIGDFASGQDFGYYEYKSFIIIT